jgi:hypothetical protein
MSNDEGMTKATHSLLRPLSSLVIRHSCDVISESPGKFARKVSGIWVEILSTGSPSRFSIMGIPSGRRRIRCSQSRYFSAHNIQSTQGSTSPSLLMSDVFLRHSSFVLRHSFRPYLLHH